MRLAMPARPLVIAVLLCLLVLPAAAVTPVEADAGTAGRFGAESVAANPGWLGIVVSVWEAARQILDGELPGGKAASAELDPDGHQDRSARGPGRNGD